MSMSELQAWSKYLLIVLNGIEMYFDFYFVPFEYLLIVLNGIEIAP